MGKRLAKQNQIYEYILQFIGEHGYSPSVREIMQAVDLQSPSTVHFHIKGLAKRGLIEKQDSTSRAIVPTDRTKLLSLMNQVQTQANNVAVLGSIQGDDQSITTVDTVDDYFHYNTHGKDGEFFALRVRDGSMAALGIMEGDLVVVHEQQKAKDGDIVVAITDLGPTIKTYMVKKGQAWLIPSNPGFSPVEGADCKIMGRVATVIRRY